MCDIDHIVPNETVRALLNGRISMGDWIVLDREDEGTGQHLQHRATDVLRRRRYDEQWYGFSDQAANRAVASWVSHGRSKALGAFEA